MNYYQILIDKGFKPIGTKGSKITMESGDTKVIFCSPCRFVRVLTGKHKGRYRFGGELNLLLLKL